MTPDRVLLELVPLGCHPERDSAWVRQDRARYFADVDIGVETMRAAQLDALREIGSRAAA